MLSIVSNKAEIIRLQGRFVENLRITSNRCYRELRVKWPGESRTIDIRFSQDLGIWWAHAKLKGRYWNIFGVGEPAAPPSGNRIRCEICIPFEEVDLTIAGHFLKDEMGRIFVAHTGKIGGGQKGIGKKMFWGEYSGEELACWTSGKRIRFALVGSLNSEHFPLQLATFVHEVYRIRSGKTLSRPIRAGFRKGVGKAPSGTQEYDMPARQVERSLDHEIVVSRLIDRLNARGSNADRAYPADLCAFDSHGSITKLFEVKTDSDSTSFYEAIGQLFSYRIRIDSNPAMIAVLPGKLKSEQVGILKKLGIISVRYDWVGGVPRFQSEPMGLGE